MSNVSLVQTSKLFLVGFALTLLAAGCGKETNDSSSLKVQSNDYFPYCPAIGKAYLNGGEVWKPGNVLTTSNGGYYFYWFKQTTNAAKAKQFCATSNHTANQLRTQGGCTCLRAK